VFLWWMTQRASCERHVLGPTSSTAGDSRPVAGSDSSRSRSTPALSRHITAYSPVNPSVPSSAAAEAPSPARAVSAPEGPRPVVDSLECGGDTACRWPTARGLHSSTFRLNVSAFDGIGGASRG